MENALLLAMGELISQEISAHRLLERLVDVMASGLGADRGTIYLLDAERAELVSVAAHLPELEELRVPLDQGVAGFVARTRDIVNIPNGAHDVRLWRGVDARTGYTTETMLAAPLLTEDGQLVGVAQFLNKQDGTFDARDEEILRGLTVQAAALLLETTLADRPAPLGEPAGAAEPLLLGERFNRIVGRGPAMRVVFRNIHRVAPTEAMVLIRGESGTGKGVIARAIHYNSHRAEGPFVHVDSTTLPETLMENELFGHERGAYTGAHARKIGQVEAAMGGTLFLDEIGDLPINLQGKLLTLLQERTFQRVGGSSRLHADIRILAATNQDLEALVAAGKFREDLYYRLRVVQIVMPPLRERGREDLITLIDHFIHAAARRHRRPHTPGVRGDALEMLLSYAWPGNVRELENCIESAVIFADHEITPSTLSLPRPRTTQSLQALRPEDLRPRVPDPFEDAPTMRELEARYIAHLLERHGGNRSECARILGIGRNTLIRKIREYDLA